VFGRSAGSRVDVAPYFKAIGLLFRNPSVMLAPLLAALAGVLVSVVFSAGYTGGPLDFATGSLAAYPEFVRSIEADSGLVTTYGGPRLKTPTAAPEYLLVPQQGTNRIVLDGEVVATDTYLPLVLLRLSRPARAEWSIVGTSDEGFLDSGVSATASVYSAALTGLSRPCATFTLITPPDYPGGWPYSVSSDGRELSHGLLRALQTVPVVVPLSPRGTARGPSASVSVKVRGQAALAGIVVSAKLAFFGVEQCPTPRG